MIRVKNSFKYNTKAVIFACLWVSDSICKKSVIPPVNDNDVVTPCRVIFTIQERATAYTFSINIDVFISMKNYCLFCCHFPLFRRRHILSLTFVFKKSKFVQILFLDDSICS